LITSGRIEEKKPAVAIKCSKCQSDNTDTARFCSNCARQLRPGEEPAAAPAKAVESAAYVLTKGSLVAGKYRVLEEIGRGGMGVVYRAEDSKLARRVAIKVLPEAFTADAERLARFEREARILASLNHPNIAAIYGVEEADGRRFLVLELVEGTTLAERLSRGPLSLEDALEVCRQIAEGLEAAHEKGIIHRDLKPANIKITPEGKVKILDFGLAKARVEEATPVDVANSPTITAEMTEPGVILGTAAYMSPEQARGKPADKRTDIWAFGCILYECLTGRRAFEGETATDFVAAILRGQPNWQALPAATPSRIVDLLQRCLRKDPRARWRDIGDARIEIEAPEHHLSEVSTTPRKVSPVWLVAGASALLMTGIFVDRLLIGRFTPRPATSSVTSIIKVEPGRWLDGLRRVAEMQRPSRRALAISRDGSFIVYSGIEENPGPQAKPLLYLRRMDQAAAKSISGTEGGINPFLSPDNRWVGFWGDGKLKKVSVEGGVPVILCDVSWLFGASWGRDGSIVFADGWRAGLSRVSAEGGTPEALTQPDPQREESSHRLPSWLPNGKAIVFSVVRHLWDQQPALALFRPDTREWRLLLPDAADARYVPTGHLVFLRQGTLMAVRFVLDRLEIIGQPFPLVENVMQAFSTNSGYNTGFGQYDISETGSLIYAPGGLVPDRKNTLVWVDEKGAEQPVTDLRMSFFHPRLSPDGKMIAYATSGREWQIWVYDLRRGTNSRLTGEGCAIYPIWAPDGQRVLFQWQRSVVANLFWQPCDGSSPMERLTTSAYFQAPGSWSSDGRTVAFVENHPDTGTDIEMLDASTRRSAPFLASSFNERYPDFSPDGRWLAFTSDESKREEVYVRPYPGPGMKVQVSGEGGDSPLWARNGRQLFYRHQAQVWVVDVRTDGGFSVNKPRLLFEKAGYGIGDPIRSYDLTLDSRRFLMVKDEQRPASPATEMVLVQNWFDALKRLAPGEKK
jgi:serine/threonine protein kinase/Tol biopolymer transport system component